MERDIILPFKETPYVLSYQKSAFPLGIIQANAHDDITPWLASKYINCRYHPENIFDICIADNWFCVDGKLFFQCIHLAKNVLEDFSVNYIKFLQKMIDLGFYSNGIYNEEHIPNKTKYKKSYFAHDYLLIGYNSGEQVFYSVGYLADRKFQKFTIPYDSMNQSLESLKETTIPFYFLKYNQSAKYFFDNGLFLQELYDYLNSRTSAKLFRSDTYFGMNAIRKMAIDILSNAKQKHEIDNRYLRALMEHKFLMVKRIEYLNSQFDLDILAIKESAIQIHKMAETVHLLGIKYSITREFSVANRIVELIDKMLILEAEYLPLLYDRVKNAQEDGVL